MIPQNNDKQIVIAIIKGRQVLVRDSLTPKQLADMKASLERDFPGCTNVPPDTIPLTEVK